MQPLKATRAQLKQHNRQLLLRAVYAGLADNRAALANISGLAKPTVSELVAELIDDGFLKEGGLGESTDSGGKRPRLLHFVPDAVQIIGIDINNQQIFGVLSNLAGNISAVHKLAHSETSDTNLIEAVMMVINGLVAQLNAPLLCIGLGSPGDIDTSSGIVLHAESLKWRNFPLAEVIGAQVDVPVYVGNKTELTALAQYAFGTDSSETQCMVTVLIDSSIEIGFTLHGANYHRGGDISSIQNDDKRLDQYLSWSYVKSRIESLRGEYPQTMLPEQNYTYLHLHFAALNGDELANHLIDELANHLAEIITWTIGFLSPDHISISGSIVELGDTFLSNIRHHVKQRISPDLVDKVKFSLTRSDSLGAIGAVAHALQQELNIL